MTVVTQTDTATLTFATTLAGDTVLYHDRQCVVFTKLHSQRQLILRPTTGTAWERREVYVSEHDYNSAGPVLVRGKVARP